MADTLLAEATGLNYRLPQNIGYDPRIEKERANAERKAAQLAKMAADEELKADKNFQDILKSVSVTDPKMLPHWREGVREKSAELIKHITDNYQKDRLRYNPYTDQKFQQMYSDLLEARSAGQIASEQLVKADAFRAAHAPDEIEQRMTDFEGKPISVIDLAALSNKGNLAARTKLREMGDLALESDYVKKKEKPMDFVKYVREYANPLQPTTKTGESGNQEIFELTPKEIEGHLQTLANSNPALGEWINQNPDEAARIISDNARKTSAKYHAPQARSSYDSGSQVNKLRTIGDPVDKPVSDTFIKDFVDAKEEQYKQNLINKGVAPELYPFKRKESLDAANKIFDSIGKRGDKYVSVQFRATSENPTAPIVNFIDKGVPIFAKPQGFTLDKNGNIKGILAVSEAKVKDGEVKEDAKIIEVPATTINWSNYSSNYDLSDYADKAGYKAPQLSAQQKGGSAKPVSVKSYKLNIAGKDIGLTKQAKGSQVSKDGKKAKITYMDGTTEIIEL